MYSGHSVPASNMSTSTNAETFKFVKRQNCNWKWAVGCGKGNVFPQSDQNLVCGVTGSI